MSKRKSGQPTGPYCTAARGELDRICPIHHDQSCRKEARRARDDELIAKIRELCPPLDQGDPRSLVTYPPENDGPTETLEEWDLERNPVSLPPLCDLCMGDATDGQSTVDGVFCPECLPRR